MRMLRSEYLMYQASEQAAMACASNENDVAMDLAKVVPVETPQTETPAAVEILQQEQVVNLEEDFSFLQDDIIFQKEDIFVGQQETVVGQLEIVVGQQEIDVGQQEIDVGQQETVMPHTNSVVNRSPPQPAAPIQHEHNNIGHILNKVAIELYRGLKEDPNWYARLYNSYEGQLWIKYPRYNPFNYKKWHYQCLFCQRQVCSIISLQNHLNQHFSFSPFTCIQCNKRYASKRTLQTHLQREHNPIVD